MNTSHGMYSCVDKDEDVNKNIVISLGSIDVDIPQHPVALHCMMTRSSKTLSKQLSEIQSQRSVMRYSFSTIPLTTIVLFVISVYNSGKSEIKNAIYDIKNAIYVYDDVRVLLCPNIKPNSPFYYTNSISEHLIRYIVSYTDKSVKT